MGRGKNAPHTAAGVMRTHVAIVQLGLDPMVCCLREARPSTWKADVRTKVERARHTRIVAPKDAARLSGNSCRGAAYMQGVTTVAAARRGLRLSLPLGAV